MDMYLIEEAIEKGDSPLVEKLFEEAIKANPLDLDLRLKHALVTYYDEINHPYGDVLDILTNILKHSPNYIPAILLKGYSEYIHNGYVKNDTMTLGDACLNDTSLHTDYWEQLLLLKARFYEKWENGDTGKHLHYLLESIKYDPNSSKNWYGLYTFYLKMGNKEKAQECIVKAAQNTSFSSPNDTFDKTSFETFINECYKGTSISSINYQSIIEEMNKISYEWGK